MRYFAFFEKLKPIHKLFIVLFAPVVALSLLACTYIFISRCYSLDHQLETTATNAAQQLAISSELAINTSNTKLISRLLKNALSRSDITHISVFDGTKSIITEVGPTSQIPSVPLSPKPYSKRFDSYLVNVSPIFHSPSPSEGLFDSQSDAFNTQTPANIIGWVKIETSTSQSSIEKYQLFFSLVAFFCLFSALVAFVAWKVSLYLMQPLDKLALGINKLAKNQYAAAKSIKLPNQYFSPQKDLLELAERLEKHKEELDAGIEQSTEDMRRNMDSMEEKSAQLYIANKEAMESSRLKSQFLANISHEVRTPLNAILGYTQILQKNIKDSQNKLYVDTIEQSTNNLLAIIGDILDFSKIEAGKLNLDNGNVNIRELVDDVYQILGANLLSNNKQIDLVTDFSPDVPAIIDGDAIRIRQILTNLISNAIKFTNKGSVKTKVTLSERNAEIITLSFQVIDTGIGIPDDKLNQLFKPFSQVDTSTTRKFGGTGLGLVITRKLVEQMGGGIDVKSTPKLGSTFHFTLKLKASNAPQPKQELLERKILFFEPSNTYRAYLNGYLEEIGVESIICSSVEQVIAKLNQYKTDINAILVNVAPTSQSAIETHELAAYAITQFNIPCILMIQPPGQINNYPVLKAICSEVLLKPISHKHLFNALKNIKPPNTLVPIEQAHQSLSIEKQQAASTKLSGLRILAVDDTPINLQLLTHWLSPNGLDVNLAHSGKRAIELAKEQKFDLILMDIQMPEMDGLETTQILRSIDAYKNTPIVALTAHALGSEQEKILASGMNAYLTKPVDENTLLNTIETWCLKKESYQEHVDNQVSMAFDLDKALSIVNQKTVIAREMFDMLADSLDNEKKLLKHHFEHQDTEKLIHVVHRIHGASKYTGTTELTRHAGFLETHLKELGLEEVDGVLEDFINSIDALLNVRELIPWPQE